MNIELEIHVAGREPMICLDDDRAEACRALEALLADEDWMGLWGDNRSKAETALRTQLDALR